MLYVIGLLFTGLIVGAFGRLLVPGYQPLGCLGTILAGLVGSFVAGLVGRHVFHTDYVPGFIASVLGAALVVWIVSAIAGWRARRRTSEPW